MADNFWDNVISGFITGVGGLFGNIPNYVMDYQNMEWQQDAYAQNFELQKQGFDLEKDYASKNFNMQEDLVDWSKEAQQTTWNREDNAIQRRAADLQAAGLSKTLAAGGAAGASPAAHISSSPISAPSGVPQMKPAQFNRTGADPSTIIMSAISMANEFSRTKADVKLADAQSRKVEEEKKGLEIDNLVKADRNREEVQALSLRNVILGSNVDEAKLDVALARAHVTDAEIKNRISAIDEKIKAKYGLSDADVQLLAKQQALSNARQDNVIKGYNLDKSQDFGLRTGDSLTTPETALEYLKAQTAAKASDGAFKKKAETKKSHGASGGW